MALGGGTFLTQNKVLPGTYINFVSAAKASATVSDRGYAAMALELDWGVGDKVFTVESAELQKDSMRIFGYDYTADALKGVREIFLNAKTLYAYRLNGSGVKASNTYAEAKYAGTRGNALKVVIAKNADEEEKFDVSLYMDETTLLDKQIVGQASELVANDYVTWKSTELEETAGMALNGGTNSEVNGASHQAFLDKIESYTFNTMGCVSTEDTIKSLYVSFVKRMREEVGAKFQLVLQGKAPDYEGVINVKNTVTDDNYPVSAAVYWVTGASAGCAVNKSNTNKVYDGEFAIGVDYTQTQLEQALKAGEFLFHRVGDEIRVLDDINSFVSFTVDKNEDFSSNQVIRVLDQIANDIAVLFNTKYLGKVQNNNAGRVALWNDIVTYNRQLEQLEAITDFVSEELTVEMGNDKKSVVVTNPVTPVVAMTKLYMTVIVR